MKHPIIVKNSPYLKNTKIIEVIFDSVYRKARFELISDRNYQISRMTDISKFDPDQTDGKARIPKDIDIWFPVVDVKLEPSMYAKAIITGIDNPKSTCRMNSYFNFEETPIINQEAIFKASALSDWENGLWIGSKEATVHSFALVKECFSAPSISKRAVCEFTTLCEDWGGTVRVSWQDEAGQWHLYGETKLLREKDCDFTELGTSSEEEALNLCIEYLFQSLNYSVNNPYKGGLFLFYDCDADTYRNGQWPWSWGSAVKFLLECAKLAEDTDTAYLIHKSPAELRRVAAQIGETTLRFVIENEEHPASNFGTTRYTPRNHSDIGYEELENSGSDTGFLCGWAWMPLYEATGDKRYLEVAENYLSALDDILEHFVIPPQEWLPQKKDWTNFTIDESGFGTEGISAVYKATKNPKYQTLCQTYMNRHLEIFERADGLWNRQYRFDTKEVEETIYLTRGLGWAMEGLLAAHRCVPEGNLYLNKAIKMANVLIQHQREDGSWGFNFMDQENIYGTADKGTALWSLLLFMLYEETKESSHLTAARKALNWCMKNQYVGSNPHAKGGILSPSGESGVTYRSYFRLCCQYTTSFMGLALLENKKWEV